MICKYKENWSSTNTINKSCNCVLSSSYVRCSNPKRIATIQNIRDVAQLYSRLIQEDDEPVLIVGKSVCCKEHCIHFQGSR